MHFETAKSDVRDIDNFYDFTEVKITVEKYFAGSLETCQVIFANHFDHTSWLGDINLIQMLFNGNVVFRLVQDVTWHLKFLREPSTSHGNPSYTLMFMHLPLFCGSWRQDVLLLMVCSSEVSGLKSYCICENVPSFHLHFEFIYR